MSTIVIGIAGQSGSGKTTLATELARTLGGTYFSLDHYYRDLSHLTLEERTHINFDDPAILEEPLLVEQIRTLAGGAAIEQPVYDFPAHTRVLDRTETIQPTPYLVIEGLFTLHYAALRPLLHLAIFVETPEQVCFARRLKRDIEVRGRSEESVRKQYEATVAPAAKQFILPSQPYADLTVNGQDATDWMVEQSITLLKQRNLLHTN